MSQHHISDKPPWRPGAVFLLLAAVLACLSVLLINRGPLYYFDTGSYIRQGGVVLNMILPEDQTSGGAAVHDIDQDDTASGSRSLLYGIITAIFFRAGTLSAVPLLHLAASFLTIWLIARVARRHLNPSFETRSLVVFPVLAATATALPFYIAYVMPDIFAPILLIAIAALAVFGRVMFLWELLLIFGLMLLAMLVHPSHMAIGGLMVPFVLLVALLQKAPNRWRASALLILVVLMTITERKVFEFAAETVVKKEVTYTPHITARLIVDGPGLAYLEETCPSEDVPTCALHEALSWSDDPYRLTASHIIFERSAELGSFRLMTPENQRRVALDQKGFFMDVFLSRPFATTFAFAENAYQQLLRHSIWMTIPDDNMLENARRLARLQDDQLHLIQGGRLAADHSWIEPINTVHGAVYFCSLVIIAGCLIWPGSAPREMKQFTLLILAGIFLNALVCGGISQPADRYGARVMWLLPFCAALLILFLPRRGKRTDTGARP